MAKLHFSLEGNSLGEFVLNKERTTIGRRPSSDIHIDNLAVSGDHAVIVTIGNDSFLEYLDSTNGTLVNTKPVKKHVLAHNDVIEFGKYQLKYENKFQEKAPATNHGFENTVVLRPAKLEVVAAPIATPETNAAEAIRETKSPEPEVSGESAPVNPSKVAPVNPSESVAKTGRLQVLSGANAGNALLLNKSLTTLGTPGVQVAVVTKRPHGYFISHVEGESLPLVNGLKIGAQAQALNDRDVIDMAGLKMEFFLD